MLRVFEPFLENEDKAAVEMALDAGWISSGGPYVLDFESSLAKLFNRKYAISMNSGTSALEAAVHALNLEPGSEVILPAFTIISCVNAVLANDLVPVFVDIEDVSWNIDAKQLASALSPKTKAIMIVHMYGQSCEVDVIQRFATDNGLALIEDASQVHGGALDGIPLGSFGDVSIFSFYANKIITTGEGGALLTNNENIAATAADYRNLYFDSERRFRHSALGRNYRLTSLQAALGRSQLARIDSIIASKIALGHMYLDIFSDLPFRKRLPKSNDKSCVYWMNAFEFEDGACDVEKLTKVLKNNGFETRYFFSNLAKQKFVQNRCIVVNDLSESDLAEKNGIYFPSSHKVKQEDIYRMKDLITECLN
jgi:perosamine synthetase